MKALGLSGDDSIVGFVYLGTPYEGKELPPKDVDLDGLVSEYGV